jgi:hypothetical protein
MKNIVWFFPTFLSEGLGDKYEEARLDRDGWTILKNKVGGISLPRVAYFSFQNYKFQHYLLLLHAHKCCAGLRNFPGWGLLKELPVVSPYFFNLLAIRCLLRRLSEDNLWRNAVPRWHPTYGTEIQPPHPRVKVTVDGFL